MQSPHAYHQVTWLPVKNLTHPTVSLRDDRKFWLISELISKEVDVTNVIFSQRKLLQCKEAYALFSRHVSRALRCYTVPRWDASDHAL